MGKLIAIPFIIMGLLFINLAFSVRTERQALEQNGVKTIATIISHTVPKPSKMRKGKSRTKTGSPTMPTYEFITADSVVHQVIGTVNGAGKPFGKKCILYYMPLHPETEYVIEEDKEESTVWAGCGGVCILFGLLVGKYAGRKSTDKK